MEVLLIFREKGLFFLKKKKERGVNIFRSVYYPNSDLINKFIENGGKH